MFGNKRPRSVTVGSLSASGSGSGLQRIAMLGTVIHSLRFGELQLIKNGLLIYNSQGVIEQLADLRGLPFYEDRAQPISEVSDLLSKISSRPFPANPGQLLDQQDTSSAGVVTDLYQICAGLRSVEEVADYRGKLILPGFIDAHCHAPQYVFTGTGMDLPLLQWLEKYTFPCEAKFQDLQFARMAYEKSIQRHLKSGTTFASYFATIHNSACKVLVDVINNVGQRAFVGKVSMDRNSPDFYIEETEAGADDAEEFARFVLSLSEEGEKFVQNIDQLDGHESVGKKRSADGFFSQGLRKAQRVSFSNTEAFATEAMDKTNSPLSPEAEQERRVRTVSMTSLASCDKLDSLIFSAETSSVEEEELRLVPFNARPTLLNTLQAPIVLPCITPRFVPTCTSRMMARLGDVSHRYGLPVQSHMSESLNEIAWVAELHPECETYASVYEKYGLLHSGSYMAHCCHSSEDEMKILSETGAGVVHCASSNFMLSSGVMDTRLFMQRGIKVALGTDVAGGYSASMLDAIRQTITASRVKEIHHRDFAPLVAATKLETEKQDLAGESSSRSSSPDEALLNSEERGSSITESRTGDTSSEDMDSVSDADPYRSLNYAEAFHLATVGGAEVMGMEKVVGNLLPGKKLDCLVVDVAAPNSPIDLFGAEEALECFQKFLFLGDDRNIECVYVDGRRVI